MEFSAAGKEHPITSGLADFELTAEQYWVLCDTLSTVLATTRIVPQPGDPWPEPYRAPVVWARQWGKGRIFITTLGHGVDDLRHPPVRELITRGMLWAAH